MLAFVEALVWWTSEGPVRIRAERRNGVLVVTTARDGATVAADEANALFLARRPGQGAGSKIGLFVSRGVAEAQGGRAWADVRDGRLVFTVELPV